MGDLAVRVPTDSRFDEIDAWAVRSAGTGRAVSFITSWMLTFTTHREGDVRDGHAPSRALLTEEAFHDAIDAHGPAVYRFAMAHVGPAHAEDVMAETFAAAWKSRASFVDPTDNGIEAWFIGIAWNMVRSHRRAERRWLRGCADALRQRADASSHVDEGELIDRLDAAELAERADVIGRLARLAPRERDPLLLHVVHGFQYQEIAAMLGVPIGTVQSRISRGRARLATALRSVQEERT